MRIFTFKAFAFLAICLLSFKICYAQDKRVTFSHLKVKALANETPLSFFQDHKGFVWIGTNTGLYRYDGYEVIAYQSSATDSSTISNNIVLDIVQDDEKNLWLATNHFINKFDPKSNLFTRYPIYHRDGSLANIQTIEELQFDSKGRLWFACGIGGGGAGYFEKDQNRFICHYNTKNGNIKNNYTHVLFIDEKDNILIGGNKGIQQYNKEKDRFEWFNKIDRVTDLMKDQSGNLWITSGEKGLFRIKANSSTLESFIPGKEGSPTISTYNMVKMLVDNEGHLWLTSENGLNYLDDVNASTPTFQSFLPNGAFGSISTQVLRGIFQDQKGAIWIGTFQNGVDIFDNVETGFELYKNVQGDTTSLANNTVWCFAEDQDGDFWIGVNDWGMEKFDRNTKTFTHLRDNLDWDDDERVSVLSIFPEDNGTMWLGTWAEGMTKYNKNTQESSLYFTGNFGTGQNIWTINRMVDNTLVAGVICEGFILVDEEDEKQSKWLRHNAEMPHDFLTSDNCVWTIYEDFNRDIWVGSHQGALKFNTIDSTFTQYIAGTKTGDLNYGQVVAFYEDSKNRFWLATYGGGLNLMDRSGETFKAYRKKDGLASDIVVGILEDDHGNLWLSTSIGISKFNPDTEIFTNYNMSHGLQADKFNLNAYYKDSEGFMYFGGINGFNRFHPDSIKGNSYIPPIVITDFKLFNKEVPIGVEGSPLEKDISLVDELTLTHEQSVFSLSFSALSYKAPELNKFAYILEDFDKEWVYTDAKRRYATYTNLPPGTYTFKVKGSNNDNLWNEEATSLVIHILPPWWNTIWAKSLLAFFIIGSAIAFYRIRVGYLKARQKDLEYQVKSRTTELQTKTEELEFANVTLLEQQEEIKSQSELVREKNTKITDSIRYAQTIQQSFIPSEKTMDQLFKKHFSLFLPKDIVSGDFYWAEHIPANEEYPLDRTYIACVDCTGHGVPGAFMSLIGNRILSRAVNDFGKVMPSEILELLDKEVRVILKQDQEHSTNTDGMDLSICLFAKDQSGQLRLKFGGAKSAIHHYKSHEGTISTYKSDKRRIGGLRRKTTPFNDYDIDVQPNDIIYLSTDGYVDQNNRDRRKFGTQHYLELLNEIKDDALNTQCEKLDKSLRTFKGSAEQRDDITVIGIKL